MNDILNPTGFNQIKKCRYGTFLFNKNDWPIGTSLREYGEYAFEELTFLRQMIRPDDLVVDAGANIGTHTVWFSQLAGHVVAFEPQRIAFQTLNANVALNNCLNVHTYHAALGKESGSILVPLRDQNAVNNFGGVPLAGITEGEPTELMKLDDLHLTRCDLIKADIEGMEAEFLAGAAETIKRHRPILYMEADGAQAQEAIKMLLDQGYECYWSIPNLFNPYNCEDKQEDVFLRDNGTPICSINMLAIPAERHVTVNGLDKIESSEDKPSFRITMRDDDISREYMKQIEKIQSLKQEKEFHYV